jgi:hypothetical protein
MLLHKATNEGICLEDFTYMQTLFHGLIVYRKPRGVKVKDLDSDNLYLAKTRTRFLKFLWCVWKTVVPNISFDNPRFICNIETSKTPQELYYFVADYVGDCVSNFVFLGKDRITFDFDTGREELQVPTKCGKFGGLL